MEQQDLPKIRLSMEELVEENIRLYKKYGIETITYTSPVSGEEEWPMEKWIREEMTREDLENNLDHKDDLLWWKKGE